MKAKYNIGDRVRYQSKAPYFDFEGTVVAKSKGTTWNSGPQLFVEPDDQDLGGAGAIWFSQGWVEHGDERDPSAFSIPTSPTASVRARRRVALINPRSKCLSIANFDYNPNQEGDLDGDI